MFLTPHHLQQADRYHEGLIRRNVKAVQPLGWGVCQVQVDPEALTGGELLLSRCSAVMPDGLAVEVPELDPAPPSRAVVPAFDAKRASLGVYLASPLARAGAASCSPEGTADGRPTRYRRQAATVADENGGAAEREIALAAKNLRVLFEGEPLDDFSALKVAELVRDAAGKFVLSETYVPPCLYLSASPRLSGLLRRVLEMISAKSDELGRQRRQRSQGLVEFTMSEAANFWFLHTLNAHIPLLSHYHAQARAHPEAVYLAMARLAGEMYTFAADGHPRDVPAYRHEALGETFGQLEERLRGLFGTVIPTRCTPVPLERTRETLYTGRLADDRLLEKAQLYLAVMAGVPEEKVAREVPIKAKVSSTDRVDQLIAAALRGLPLRHLATPPAEIPVQPGRTYFQIERSGEHWESVKKSRSISFYVPPEFTQLKLELMAVKE